MFSSRYILSYNVSGINATTIRGAARFKVLKSEVNHEDVKFRNAKARSINIRNILNYICDFAKAGGGKKGMHRHTVINRKLLVRDRLKLLFDPDSSLLEIGLLSGMCMDYGTIPAASSVAAIGKIHGQYCIVGANDATVKGGTFFPISIVKQLRVQQLSLLNHLPCIYLVDSGGAYLPLQADIFPDKDHGGRTFYNEAVLSSLGIPQIALVCGSCTAGGAYCPTMAEEAIIVKNLGTIFLAGPPLVKAATGEIVSEQDLGGADVHCRVSGCTDYYADNEEEAFEMCRESVLSLNLPVTPSISSYEEPVYPSSDLSLIAGQLLLSKEDMYIVLSRILDGSMFKEFKQKFGQHLITGFGYIHGMLIGLLANCNPLDFQDAQKGTHFIQLCNKRNIPLVFLQNSGQLLDDTWNVDFLSSGYLRDRAKMVAAHSCSNVPKITINVGGCFSDDSFTMCSFGFQPNFSYSWPLAHVCSSRTSREQLQKKEEELLNTLNMSKDISDYETLFEDETSAFYQASRMVTDGIIHPEDTRQVLALCLDICQRKFCAQQHIKQNSLAILRM